MLRHHVSSFRRWLVAAVGTATIGVPLVLVAGHTPSVSATSTTATFSAAADAFVSSGNPSTNYGTRSVLKTDASPTVRSYLRFNVANLSAPVTKATLQVYAKDSNAAGFNVASVANTTWGETSVTYGNAPAAGSVVGTSGALTAGQWYSVDVTGLVAGNGAVSFALSTSSSAVTRYASREAGSTGPRLVVETSLSTTTTTAPSTTTTTAPPTTTGQIKHLWVMMMENTAWSTVATDSNFQYVQTKLLPNGAYAKNYVSAPSGEATHPSLPNYVRLEAGSDLGITSGSCLPSTCPGNTTNHFATLFKTNNVTWKTYHENLPGDGTTCPVNMDNVKGYSEDHNAPLYFPDFTKDTAYCQSHERPYSELATDLSSGKAPQFSFIVPNDFHTGEKFEPGYSGTDIRHKYLQQDQWLSVEIPKIMASAQYQDGGAILILWDETAFGSSDPHSGCILMSPLGKKGYSNTVAYTHDSTVKSIQEIFGVTSPWLGKAGTATDLRDLFTVAL